MITLAVCNLVLLPFGTALGAYALWVLLSATTRKLFEPALPSPNRQWLIAGILRDSRVASSATICVPMQRPARAAFFAGRACSWARARI
jgi:hypothetical protein